MSNDLTPVRCPHCGTLFGIERPDGSLAIKFKDLFRTIEGRVEGPCRKCGSHVVWPSEPVVLVTTK